MKKFLIKTFNQCNLSISGITSKLLILMGILQIFITIIMACYYSYVFYYIFSIVNIFLCYVLVNILISMNSR